MNKYSDQSKVGKQLYRRVHRKGAITCIKKRSHWSSQSAKDWLKQNGYTGTPYRCPHCHKWHVTSSS